MKLKFILPILSSLACVGHAATIGVNFVESLDGHPSQQMLSTTTAGIVPQANWNTAPGATGTLNDLVDSTGASTGSIVTWSSGGVWGDGEAEADALAGVGDAQLARGYLDDGGEGADFTVSGIPYADYSATIYFSTDNQGGSYLPATINGNVYQTTGDKSRYGSNPNWDATNTITVTGLSGDLVVDSLPRDGDLRGSVAGFQIVDAIPEPSTALLAGLAGFALVFRRRR